MLERRHGALFSAFLVFGVVAAAWSPLLVTEYLTRTDGPVPAHVFDPVLRIATAAVVLWLAWFVFRPRSPV